MKKVKLFSLILAVMFCLTICLTACDGADVGKHDHVWDNGEITTQPTCHSEGVKTYHCTVKGCEQTMTEPIQQTAHNWDGGTQTKAPKCNEFGETTYHCTNDGCTATKTDPIAKTPHDWDDGVITSAPDFGTAGMRTYTCQYECGATDERSIEAHADFAEQFNTAAQTAAWSYGAATAFDAATGEFTFEQAESIEGVWTATGVQISASDVSVTSAKAAIGYTFGEGLPAHCKAAFTVKYDGAVRAYVAVIGEGGAVKAHKALNETAAAVNYDECDVETDAVEIVGGDTLYLVLDSESATVQGELSFTLYAPCLHYWTSKVIEEPTCAVEGTREYTCGYCNETYTEQIGKTQHQEDDGRITVAPTLEREGIKGYFCKNCGAWVRNENVAQLDGSIYGAIANFHDDFSTTEDNGWVYGYTDDYDFETNDFTFKPLSASSASEWGGADGVIIKNDWILSEAKYSDSHELLSDNKAIVGYTVPAGQTQLTLDIRFEHSSASGTADTSETRMAVRVVVVGQEGVKSADYVDDGARQADWVSARAVDVAEGDKVYVILFHEVDAWSQGKLQIIVIGAKTSSDVIADFGRDFSQTLEGQGNWSVGTIDYHWEQQEAFDFAKDLTAQDGAFKKADSVIEVKGDWMVAGGMIGLAYRFDSDADIEFAVSLQAKNAGATFSVRYSVGTAAGGTGEGFHAGASIEFTAQKSVHTNDVLYILVNMDSEATDGDLRNQCDFSIVIKDKNVSQPDANVLADFQKDFSTDAQSANGWKYGYATDFVYDTNNEHNAGEFTFNPLTPDGDAWKDALGDQTKIEVKKDWFRTERDGGDVAIGYTVPTGQTKLKVEVTFTHNPASEEGTGQSKTELSARIVVIGSDGKAKSCTFDRQGYGSWNIEKELDVAEGDTVYVVLFDENADWRQGTLQIVISKM